MLKGCKITGWLFVASRLSISAWAWSIRNGIQTSQKADGTKEGLSLEAKARTGADAAIAPCETATHPVSQALPSNQGSAHTLFTAFVGSKCDSGSNGQNLGPKTEVCGIYITSCLL